MPRNSFPASHMGHDDSIDATDLIEQLFAAGRRIALATSYEDLLQVLGDAVSGNIRPFNKEASLVVTPADYCGIFQIDSQDGRTLTVTTLATWDRRAEPAAQQPEQRVITVGTFFDLIREGEVLVIDDVGDIDNDRRLDDADRALLRSTRMLSMICAPLMIHQQVFAILFIGMSRPHIYTYTEIRFYQMLADQVALAYRALPLPPSREANQPAEERLVEPEVPPVPPVPEEAETLPTPLQTVSQRERELLEAIIEATNDGILMIDTARIVVTANLQFETFFNVPRYECLNQPVDFLIEHLRKQPHLPVDLANIILMLVGDAHDSAGGDFTIITPKERIFIWYSAPVHGHDGAILGRLFVFRDATREREVDRMKTEFVSLVSHELRTPLTSIRGFTDLILEGASGGINDETREFMYIIKINSDRLIALVNDILDVTRIETGHMQVFRKTCNIGEIIRNATAALRENIDERQQLLSLVIRPSLPLVWGDAQRIGQVVNNLVSNASKYSPEGSRIIVEARLVESVEDIPETPPHPVYIPSVLVAVHDTGIGISEADQPLVFTRFFRTEQVTKQQIAGTGLGLTIAKSFVELHRGQIWFNSTVGRGSSFFFTIPLIEVA